MYIYILIYIYRYRHIYTHTHTHTHTYIYISISRIGTAAIRLCTHIKGALCAYVIQDVSLIQRVLITLVLRFIMNDGFSFDLSIACSELFRLSWVNLGYIAGDRRQNLKPNSFKYLSKAN